MIDQFDGENGPVLSIEMLNTRLGYIHNPQGQAPVQQSKTGYQNNNQGHQQQGGFQNQPAPQQNQGGFSSQSTQQQQAPYNQPQQGGFNPQNPY